MNSLLRVAGLALLGLFLLCGSCAAQGASATEAQALVGKAVAFLKANGKDAALAEFNKPHSAFVDRDLYIFVLDQNGVTLANGVNPKIVGKNVMEMKDANDKPFIKALFALANSKGSGWVDYQWPDPVSKKIRPKSTYVEKAGDWLLCAGVYK